jgi:Family of unknown function (DUF6535)
MDVPLAPTASSQLRLAHFNRISNWPGMSANVESHVEDIPMEDVQQPQELASAAKKVYSRLPRAGAGTRTGHMHGLFSEPEYTVWDVYNNEARKVDTELVNDWKESLNSLLLFVSNAPSMAHIY